jgi:hypothetical protein
MLYNPILLSDYGHMHACIHEHMTGPLTAQGLDTITFWAEKSTHLFYVQLGLVQPSREID